MLLVLDTALETCQAGLFKGNMPFAIRSQAMVRGHAERLMPMVEELFIETNTKPRDLTKIGVTIGPGSFTGLRVALSAALSMAQALSIPVVGISTLDCLLEAGDLAVIDARHDHAYAKSTRLEAGLYSLAHIKNHLEPRIIGSGGRFLEVDCETQLTLQALATLSLKATNDTHPALPLYLKAADVTPQIKGKIALVV